jgi:hypothetical protein
MLATIIIGILHLSVHNVNTSTLKIKCSFTFALTDVLNLNCLYKVQLNNVSRQGFRKLCPSFSRVQWMLLSGRQSFISLGITYLNFVVITARKVIDDTTKILFLLSIFS